MTPLESLPLAAALLGCGVLAFRWVERRAGAEPAFWAMLMLISTTVLLMDAIRG